ncbi:MAG TPA: DUF642 domain-containing protein [Thermoanaerobaculia bacterium]|nr:DUF642 domain-containing protein [Thermoanaerobaculia bacterium]
MRSAIPRYLLLVAVSLFIAATASAQDIVNGSFEDPLKPEGYNFIAGGEQTVTGWTALYSGVEQFDPILVRSGVAHEGIMVIDLNPDALGGGGLQQTLETTVGEEYLLTFYASALYSHGRNNSASIEVKIGGTTYPFTVLNDTDQLNWQELQIAFTATTRQTTISFASFDAPNTSFAIIDDVSIMGSRVIPSDSDLDHVPDSEDTCPYSNLTGTITIDGCDTGVPNGSGFTGCTMNDELASCANNTKNHGDYVSCVSALTNGWKKAGAITGQQKGAIEKCAAQSAH